MKITILYLYYDLLNLYGDNGNIKALIYHLKSQGIKVNIKYLSINDKKDFSKYDLVYIGSGTFNNLLLALDDLIKYKNEIKKAIKDKKYFLITGNAIELFGKNIEVNNKVYQGLNCFNYYTKYHNKRIVKDSNYKCDFIDNNIIGFENHNGKIISKEKSLFNSEGIKKNNFYGSYIIGPLLVRNPEFCEYFIRQLVKSINKDFKFKDFNFELDKLSYSEKIKSTND